MAEDNTRIYRVQRMDTAEIEADEPPKLVSANHPNVALRHVARRQYDVRVASQTDLVMALKEGAIIERAGQQE